MMNKPNTVHIGKRGQRIVKNSKPHIFKLNGYWCMTYVGWFATRNQVFNYEMAKALVIDLNGVDV